MGTELGSLTSQTFNPPLCTLFQMLQGAHEADMHLVVNVGASGNGHYETPDLPEVVSRVFLILKSGNRVDPVGGPLPMPPPLWRGVFRE